MTLTQRLFLVATVALLPSLLILGLSLYSLRQEADRRLHLDASNNAGIAALEVDRIIGGVESVLRAVANTKVVMDGNAEECTAFLARVTKATGELADMAIADASGNVVCRSVPSGNAVSVADRHYFAAALAEGGPVVGSFSQGRLTGRNILPIAMPITGDGAWAGGVVAAGLSLEWLGQRLKERDFSQGNSFTIADRNGRILAREPLPERFVGTDIPDAFAHLVNAPTPGTVGVTSQDGTRRVIGYVPTTTTHGLYISVGVATARAHAMTERLILQGTVVALAGIAVAFAVAWFTSNHFIRRPFLRILDTVEAWQRNEMDRRTDMGGDLAEFGRAGRALDRFMDQLVGARTARAVAEHQREVMAREMAHRVKNIVATIQAVARLTFRGKGLDEPVRIFNDRLAAMASAHGVLMAEGWHSAPIRAVVDQTIAPFADPDQSVFRVQGEDLDLSSKASRGLSMALHELCTNAVKYGALSAPGGHVNIRWWTSDGADPRLHFEWVENGGPPVAPPGKRGFGSTMIEQILAAQVGGSVRVDFATTGLRCAVSAPLANVVAASDDVPPGPMTARQT